MDSYNRFESNHIHENGFAGVYFRAKPIGSAPLDNVFYQNTIEDNGNDEEGYGIFFNWRENNGEQSGNVFDGNIIRDNGQNRQRIGIWFPWDMSLIKIGENEMEGHSGGDIVNEKRTRPNWPTGTWSGAKL